jgi:hypothetical protein
MQVLYYVSWALTAIIVSPTIGIGIALGIAVLDEVNTRGFWAWLLVTIPTTIVLLFSGVLVAQIGFIVIFRLISRVWPPAKR